MSLSDLTLEKVLRGRCVNVCLSIYCLFLSWLPNNPGILSTNSVCTLVTRGIWWMPSRSSLLWWLQYWDFLIPRLKLLGSFSPWISSCLLSDHCRYSLSTDSLVPNSSWSEKWWGYVTQNGGTECFHSREQWACFFKETKENVCIRMEFNSRRISWGHQHGRSDVTRKESIDQQCFQVRLRRNTIVMWYSL